MLPAKNHITPRQLMLMHACNECCLAWRCKGLWYTCVLLSATVIDLWNISAGTVASQYNE